MSMSFFRSVVPSFLILSLATGAVLVSSTAPAKATRPLVRTAVAINTIRLAIPVSFDTAYSSDQLGIDLEDPQIQKATMKQANDYIELRRGRLSKSEIGQWLDKCERSVDTNPFCRYEIERKLPASKNSSSRRAERHAIANDLRGGAFERIAGRSYADVVNAVSIVENEGRLAKIAMQVADNTECLPTALTTAIAYKLEERFPAIESIELAKRLYRKSSACGKDGPSAQGSFRLGLIEIWQNRCDGVPELMLKVEATPEGSAFHPRAKYWRYFCAMQSGDESARKVAKDTLFRDHPMTFHALAAGGEDVNWVAKILSQSAPPVAYRSIVRPEMNVVLRAVEALNRKGASYLGAEMLDKSIRDIGALEPEVRLYLAVVLNRGGHTLTKFKVLNELFQDAPETVTAATLKLFFPLSYLDLLQTKREKVDPLLILSLIRQESAFNKEARSIAGARGLMQVMPATARTVAAVRATKLFDPATNIGVGTKYFLKRLEQYGGDVELTLAAYNAGFMRVDQWRKRYPTDNRLLFLDFIPFRETREYVSSILRNYYWYVRLYSPQAQTVSETGQIRDQTRAVDSKVMAIVSANAGAAANSIDPSAR